MPRSGLAMRLGVHVITFNMRFGGGMVAVLPQEFFDVPESRRAMRAIDLGLSIVDGGN